MTYFDRVTGPFHNRKGSRKDQYELRFWVGSTRVGTKHWTSKSEAQKAKESIVKMLDDRRADAPLEPAGPMDAAKTMDFWLLSLWDTYKNAKKAEDAAVLKAKAQAIAQAQRMILFVGGREEPVDPDLKNITQEELEAKLKVINGGAGE